METEKLSNCPQCGQTIDGESIYCTNCAFQINQIPEVVTQETASPKNLSPDAICPNCGTRNLKDTLFCNSCGKIFETQTALPIEPFNTARLEASIVPPESNFNNSLPPPQPLPIQNQIFPAASAPPNIFAPPSANSSAYAVPANTSQKNLIISIVSVVVIIVALFAIFSSINSSNTSRGTSATPTPKTSDSPNNSNPYSSIIGKYGKVIDNDLKIRSDASPNASQIGVLYMNSRIKILDAKNGETGTLWYRVKVVEYGCSRVPELGCGKDNPNDQDEGWAFSGYVSLEN